MTTPTVPIPHPIEIDDAYKQRDELAMLEGHDADIPVEERPSTGNQVSLSARETSPSPAGSDGKVKDEEQGLARTESKREPGITQEENNELNVVSWNGPDDPANPLNWSESLKWGNVAAIAAITFIT